MTRGMGWNTSDPVLAHREPCPSPGTSHGAAQTHTLHLYFLSVLTSPSPAPAQQSAKRRSRLQWQIGSHSSTLTQPVPPTPQQLSWSNTSTDRHKGSYCIWSSGISGLIQQGWQSTTSTVSSCVGALASPSASPGLAGPLC